MNNDVRVGNLPETTAALSRIGKRSQRSSSLFIREFAYFHRIRGTFDEFRKKLFDAIDDLQFIRVRVAIQFWSSTPSHAEARRPFSFAHKKDGSLLYDRGRGVIAVYTLRRDAKWKGRGIETRKTLFLYRSGAGIKTFQPAGVS